MTASNRASEPPGGEPAQTVAGGHPGSDRALSRRGFLRASLAAAAASTGAYGLLDQLAGTNGVPRTTLSSFDAGSFPPEQYLFKGTRTVTDDGVIVEVPPLHHEVVTAKLDLAGSPAAAHSAQKALESVLARLEAKGVLTFTPSGLGLAVGWGLGYFSTRLPSYVTAKMPLDLEAPKVNGSYRSVLTDSVRFATDPIDVLLEDNDVIFVMGSDALSPIAAAYEAIFEGAIKDLFEVTSIRKGFIDARRLGTSSQSLTKQFALASKLPGAELMPDQAELFLGFTSTQSAGLGPRNIPSFESLGMTNQTPRSYFAGGTILAISHLYENLQSWYGYNSYSDRVQLAFRPSLAGKVKQGTLTIAQSGADAETRQDLQHDLNTYGLVGHAGSMQPVSRLQADTNGFAKGTAIPLRADFNTIDHPFAYSADPARDGWSSKPSAGLHFLSYVPTSYYFERLRAAMDGGLTTSSGAAPGFQQFVELADISTTHRQNYLIPPRAHRSFPLAELW